MAEQEPRRITPQQREHFDRPGFSGDIYMGPEASLALGASLIVVHGNHPLKRMIDATRSYFVVDGQGEFTLNGEKMLVNKGDLVVIPPGGEYRYHGIMTLFEVNVPPTTSANSVTLEE